MMGSGDILSTLKLMQQMIIFYEILQLQQSRKRILARTATAGSK